MKKLTFPLFLFVLFLSSQSISAQDWWGNSIKGEGPIVTKNLDLSDFSGISLGIAADVYLTYGNTQSVKVEGQANIIENLKNRVSGDDWHISYKQNVRNAKNVTIHITIPHLTAVKVSGSGSLEATNHFPNLDELDIKVSGSGKIKLDVGAKYIDTAVSGSGSIKLAGSTNKHRITVSGSGNVSSYDMETNNSRVTISGSGECKINVREELKATVSGSGDVYYKGNPSVQSKISGSGDVTSRD